MVTTTAPADDTASPATRRLFGWWVAAITAIAAVAVGRGIGTSLWGDETITASTVSRSFTDTVAVLGNADGGFAGYSLFMNRWVALGGTSEFWLQLPSLLAVLGTIVLAAVLGRWLAGPVAGIVAAVLLALHLQLTSNYALEARPYALTVLAVTAVAALLYRSSSRGFTTRTLVAIGVLVAVAISLHTLSVVAVAAMVLWLISATKATTWNRSLAVTASVMVVIDAAVLLVMVSLAARFTDLQMWLTQPTIGEVFVYSRMVAGVPALGFLLASVGVFAAAGARRWTALRVGSTDLWTLVLWAVGPLVVLTVGGWLYKPMLTLRYVLSSAVAWALLAGVAVAVAWELIAGRKVGRIVFACGLAAIAVVAGSLSPVAKIEDPRGAAEWIAHDYQPGDAIIYSPSWCEPAVRWYLSESPDSAVLPDGGPVNLAAGEKSARDADSFWTPSRPDLVGLVKSSGIDGEFERLVAGRARIWLVSIPAREDEGWDPIPEVGVPLGRALSSSWTDARSKDFGAMKVTLYTRPSR